MPKYGTWKCEPASEECWEVDWSIAQPEPEYMEKEAYEATCPHVCVKGEWYPADWMQFLDIEEDFQGFDVMTFKWKGKEYRSRIQYRPR